MSRLARAWYRRAPWLVLLSPLSALFGWLAARRRLQFQLGRKPRWQSPVPVIVVGNITAGGTGKTPLVAWLALALKARGYRPGIVSRGYRSAPPVLPFLVSPQSHPKDSGDEALMLAQQTEVPVVIDPDRPRACQALLNAHPDCNVLISDDGLQHYALARDLELVVVDAERGFGNERLMPAGPLREPLERLHDVDMIILNGPASLPLPADCAPVFRSVNRTLAFVHLLSGEERAVALESIPGSRVHAVAGIGHPDRFYHSLSSLGFAIIPHTFEDHHAYRREDIHFNDALPVIMTEKDAVKCRGLVDDDEAGRYWYLRIAATPEAPLLDHLLSLLDLQVDKHAAEPHDQEQHG